MWCFLNVYLDTAHMKIKISQSSYLRSIIKSCRYLDISIQYLKKQRNWYGLCWLSIIARELTGSSLFHLQKRNFIFKSDQLIFLTILISINHKYSSNSSNRQSHRQRKTQQGNNNFWWKRILLPILESLHLDLSSRIIKGILPKM